MKLLPAAYELPEPIRPQQCGSYSSSGGHGGFIHARLDRETCTECGGQGFHYPDPPDEQIQRYIELGKRFGQTNTDYFAEAAKEDWHGWLEDAWLVLGVVVDA